MFPDTATGDYLDRWGSYKNVFRLPATQSSGKITAIGSAGSVIPINTQLQSSSGVIFITQQEKTIQTQNISVISLTRSGNTVTATTVSDHYFANGNTITLSGANEIGYNGSFQIVVTSGVSFTYEILNTPATPATGTIIATATFVSLDVKSSSYGLSANFANGSELFFASNIAGVATSAIVQYEGITGGIDAESDDNFRKRVLYAYQHPISFFSEAEITTKCQELNGVTRVFVEQCTPDVGQVTVYFMRDNDNNPIPSGSQVDAVKDKILTIKPAHVDPNDIIVKAPTPKPIHFKFSVLDPNTDAMKTAIQASLQAFFSEVPVVSQNLSKNSYASAIYYTVDPTTGSFVHNFVLAYPLGDILINDGEIATFGGIDT
jgi:uncharacterized phage protein gp47/JayE